jgi:hypothetical protein
VRARTITRTRSIAWRAAVRGAAHGADFGRPATRALADNAVKTVMNLDELEALKPWLSSFTR